MAVSLGPSIQITGFTAGADLSAKRFRPVKPASTAGAVVLATSTADKQIGILVNAPANGRAAEIVTLGNAKAHLGKGVVAGDLLSAGDSTGNLLACTAGRAVAIALEACTATGNLHPVFVLPTQA